MGEYDRQVATAKRLIAKKGQDVTWKSLEDGAPSDPSKPWRPSAATSTEHTVKIAFLPVDRRGDETRRYREGTAVPEGSLLGYMAQVDFTPALKDVIVRDGEELTVLNFDLIAPNGTPILYILELGR